LHGGLVVLLRSCDIRLFRAHLLAKRVILCPYGVLLTRQSLA
jgi:hypothetical protein